MYFQISFDLRVPVRSMPASRFGTLYFAMGRFTPSNCFCLDFPGQGQVACISSIKADSHLFSELGVVLLCLFPSVYEIAYVITWQLGAGVAH